MVSFTRRLTRWLSLGLFILSFCFDGKLLALKSGEGNNSVKNSSTSILEEVGALSKIDFPEIWTEVSKKIVGNPLPLMTIEGKNLQKVCQKVTELVDKILPESASLISLAIMGFAGGLPCPGVDENAACYVVIFLHEGKIEPVFLFKALVDSLLVKNLNEVKNTRNILRTIQNDDLKKFCWQMYGNSELIKVLDKDVKQFFPFIYASKPSEMCLKISLDFDNLNEIFEKIENKKCAFFKFLWNMFFVPDIKKIEMSGDIEGKTLHAETRIYPQDSSSLSTFVKSLEAKNKDVHFLHWSSRETIQKCEFQDYLGVKNYIKSLDARMKYKHRVTEYAQFKNFWEIFYPFIEDILTFCSENLTGNTQSYADLQNSNGLGSLKSFGFFETKKLNQTTFLGFMQGMVKKVSAFFNAMIDKKCFCWEFCKDLSLNVKKSVEKHCGYGIDQIFWKTQMQEAYCPIWFTVCKNYLLYADNIDDLKRLIERMLEKKSMSYQDSYKNGVNRIQINWGAIMHGLGFEKIPLGSEMLMEMTYGAHEGIWTNTIRVPKFLDVFSVKTGLPLSKGNDKNGAVNRLDK